MEDLPLRWINKDAETGPVFAIGPDVYVRERPGLRALRLTTTYAPGLEYLNAAVTGFRELAQHWGAPVVFILEPDVKKPPAIQFLYRWSEAAWSNGSVDQSFMLAHNAVTKVLFRIVLRGFTDDMPFTAVNGEAELRARLDAVDLACPRPGFAVRPPVTALTLHRKPEGALEQLFFRLVRRATGGKKTPGP